MPIEDEALPPVEVSASRFDGEDLAAKLRIVQALEALIVFFGEFPAVSLTAREAEREFGYDAALAEGVLRALAAADFLVEDAAGSFRRHRFAP